MLTIVKKKKVGGVRLGFVNCSTLCNFWANGTDAVLGTQCLVSFLALPLVS